MLNPQNIGPGQEQYEMFTPYAFPGRKKKKHCQYDYRDADGELFSCVAASLNTAREICRAWREKRTGRMSMRKSQTSLGDVRNSLSYISIVLLHNNLITQPQLNFKQALRFHFISDYSHST
jgi:hypothetical protein